MAKDTAFGYFLRFITNGRICRYPEEKDSRIWRRYALEKGMLDVGSEASSSKESSLEQARIAAQIPQQQPGLLDLEVGKDSSVVDWYGPDDPENPLNWSSLKKALTTLQICLLSFAVYIGGAIYSTCIEDVGSSYNVSNEAATLGLTLFVLGYAMGPMLWSPLSEIPQLGRSSIYVATLVLFAVLQIPIALAPNFGTLLAFRFITGFVGSPALATGGASITDIYNPRHRTYGLAIWAIGSNLGPILGPMLGGFAVEAKGWTWSIWEMAWLSGGVLISIVFLLPETSAANILYRRSRRLRQLTGNHQLVCAAELQAAEKTAQGIALSVLVRPFRLLLMEPIVLVLSIYLAIIYGLLYAWFESFSIVFRGVYGFSLGIEGLAFLGILVGYLLVIPPWAWYQRRYIEPKFNENNEVKPEMRLLPVIGGAFALPICLFMFGWTSRRDIHWIVPIIATGLYSIGSFLLFNSVLNYLPDAYPTYAASVLAGNSFLRATVAAGFPLFSTAMYKHLGIGWASSTLGFICVAFIPVPFVLLRCGRWLRLRSRYARHDL